MKKILKIAWRNLWRNKRRTLITISSIFFAFFYAILMRSFQLGTYNMMIDNIVSQFSGHLQIQDIEYFDEPLIDYAIPYTDTIKQILNDNKQIEYYFPRIQTGVLASSGKESKIAMIMGVDYETEIKLVGLNKNIVRFYLDSLTIFEIAQKMDKKNSSVLLKYKEKRYSNKKDLSEDLYADGLDTTTYIQEICEKTALPEFNFNENNDEILVGYKMAQFLNLNQGDTIILIGQGFRGNNAVGKFKIGGLLQFPIEEMNRLSIYMPIKTAQIFLSAFDINDVSDTIFYVNYIAINTIYEASMTNSDYNKLLKIKKDIEEKLDNKLLTVVAWRNLNPNIMNTVQMGNSKGAIFIFILYLVIAFGILGTVMMLISERKREFGVMMALGMKRKLLSLIVSLEMIFMGLIASVAGIIITTPIMWLGNKNPIKLKGNIAEQFSKMNMVPVIKLEFIDFFVLEQIFVVFFIVVIVLIYAIFQIRKLKVISSLRS